MRIDKLLAGLNFGTRTEIKKDIRAGLVKVNGILIRQPDYQVTPTMDIVSYRDIPVIYTEYEYYLLNKPAGYVSAKRDNVYPTVMELLTDTVRPDLFPVGRLDVDTEGLLLITNDGQLSHFLLSPKRHVDKVYFARIAGLVTPEDTAVFLEGVDIGEAAPTLPAKLEILSIDADSATSEIRITLHEGKFHQIKRMFQAVGKEVTYLKRIAMGSLVLDESLPPGGYRHLTAEETAALKEHIPL